MCTLAVYLNMQENSGPFEASVTMLIQNPSPWSLCKAERARNKDVVGPPPARGVTGVQSLVDCVQMLHLHRLM